MYVSAVAGLNFHLANVPLYGYFSGHVLTEDTFHPPHPRPTLPLVEEATGP